MNALASITAPLDPATFALVEALARARGISGAEFAAEAIRRVAAEESDFSSFVQAGIASADAGELYTQDEVEAWFEERVAARRG